LERKRAIRASDRPCCGPAIEIDGDNVAIEIEIATGEDTVQVRAKGVLVARKGCGEELDALVWLIVDGSGVTAVKVRTV